MLIAESQTTTLIGSVAQLVSALAWPSVATVLLIIQREPLKKLIAAIVALAESANKIKISVLEVERTISEEVTKSAAVAQTSPDVPPLVTESQADAAKRVGQLVNAFPGTSARDTLLQSIKENMKSFAEEYERVRSAMPGGKSRTKAMNAVAAKMRTLAIAARPFLDEFAFSSSPGRRLAAICILEISPDFAYLNWLVERMEVEAPFVFFHASLALLAMVTKFGFEANAQLAEALERALRIANSYSDGPPDPNTVRVLHKGLEELYGLAESSEDVEE